MTTRVIEGVRGVHGEHGEVVYQLTLSEIEEQRGRIEALLSRALVGVEEINVETIVQAVAQGTAQLWGGWVDGELEGVMVTELVQYPLQRIARVVALGAKKGQFHHFRQFLPDVEVWARINGCVKLEGWCHPVPSRIFQDTLGFEKVYEVVRYDLRRGMV